MRGVAAAQPVSSRFFCRIGFKGEAEELDEVIYEDKRFCPSKLRVFLLMAFNVLREHLGYGTEDTSTKRLRGSQRKHAGQPETKWSAFSCRAEPSRLQQDFSRHSGQ
ncbi:hypothetical protein AMECASPLE_014210 [Ameca splendens]|uniref:Uncharacterized protein n=1 Tax=Ameca splendens TaxID=208324 RepID=A0ABV0ZLE0_9TELE